MPDCARPDRQIKPADLRGILEYVPMFRDHIFVIAMDGSIIEHDNFANIITEIAVLRSLNIKVVLVHGIGEQLRRLAIGRGTSQSDIYGEGVTDGATLELARETAGVVSQTILEALTHAGLKTAVTNTVRATRVGVLRGVDQEFTGKVDKMDTAFIASLLEQGVVPLFPPLQCDREGRPLRVNSDLLAAQAAVALGASKLIFLTDSKGLIIDGRALKNIPLAELSAIFRQKRSHSIAERLRSKALHAIHALENGVSRAHILDGRVPSVLLTEIFDKVGLGTMIHANDYDRIRPARKKDAQAIYNITKQGVRNEALVQRSRARIEQCIEEYFVYEIDGSVIACACLRPYAEKRQMEVGSVYVQPFYQGRDVGRKLVAYAELKAAEAGCKRLFALTTQTHAFFSGVCGFKDASLDDLPAQRRKELEDSGRNSRVLFKDLKATLKVNRKRPAGDTSV
jgi:amino-acid N-acetyltransferase